MQTGEALLTGDSFAPIVLTQGNSRALIALIGDRHYTIAQRNGVADSLMFEVSVEFRALALGQAWINHEAQVLYIVVER